MVNYGRLLLQAMLIKFKLCFTLNYDNDKDIFVIDQCFFVGVQRENKKITLSIGCCV